MIFCAKDIIQQSLTFNLEKSDLFGKSSNDTYEYKINMKKRNKEYTLLI